MRTFTKYLLLFFISFVLLNFAAVSSADTYESLNTPKNIILFVGDGMGIGAITAAKVVNQTLNLEQFKTAGFLTTATDYAFLVTSAEPTMALSTGFDSKKGYVALSPQKKPLKTVLEYAEEKGKSTGLVVTSKITDVTSACFAAHVDSRHKVELIAEHTVNSGVDVLFGGGLDYFLPSSGTDKKGRHKKSLIAEMEKRHKVITSAEEFRQLGTPKGVFGIFAKGSLPFVKEREISLPEMTEKAIEILSSNEKGFFLMVEGSHIDWGAHRGDSETVILETIDLDNAIGVALEFAKKDGRTLIIVTSDHETGGFSIIDGSVKDKYVRKSVSATTGHTANMVPLFAYGPGSETLGGIHNHAFVGKTMIRYVEEWEPSNQP